MPFSNNEIATYLFCAQLPQTKTNPLTIIEWNAVVKSLGDHNLEPEELQIMTPSELENILINARPAQRSNIVRKIEARQKLGISMLELEGIIQQGYGIMFRAHMPPSIKKLTQKFLPAFFYYIGDLEILSYRALGVVGARSADDDELKQTADIAKVAVSNGVVITSGGARGIDTVAVDTALEAGGKAIVFPAEGLAKWIKKSTIREYIKNGQLLIMSTQRPEAPFSGHYAMLRNKYIHATPNAVLVASSKITGTKSSGTWEGVLDNLKMQWSPLYVIGNSEGVERLKTEGNAKVFTTFDELYKSSMVVDLATSFEIKAKEIIQIALDNGLEINKIESIFKGVIEHYIKLDPSDADKKLLKLEKEKEVEQLSIVDLLKEEQK